MNIFVFLRYPDDEERKNLACSPHDAPQLPVQWWELQHISNMNGDKIGKELGVGWMRRSRLLPFHHMSFFDFLKLMISMVKKKDSWNEKLKLFGEQQEIYDKIETTQNKVHNKMENGN